VQRPAAVAASPAPGFRATDDGFEGHSLSITCEASAEGVRFVPAEAGVSSDALALGYALRSVRAGDHSFFARESAAQPELERYDTILFRHPGGVEERYHVRATGIEQTFVIADETHLRSGHDLIVEGALTGALTPDLARRTSDHDPIAFAYQDRVAVTCGTAIAIDARGDRLTLRTTAPEGAMQIIVDGAWLAQAAFPVTIDPLFGSAVTVTAGSNHERYTDVAYSRTSDRYLVVWDSEVSGDDHDVFGALLAGDGQLVAGPFAIDNSADNTARPSVAWSPNGDKFLVAWEDDVYAMGLNGKFDIVGAFVDATGVPGTSFDIHKGISTHQGVSVGAEDAPGGNFFAAWTRKHWLTGDHDAVGKLVRSDSSNGRLRDLTAGGVHSREATVNKLGRGPLPWLVCWSDDYDVANDIDVWAMPIDNQGDQGGLEFQIAWSTQNEGAPAIAGDGNEWFVAHTVDYGQGDLDVNAQIVDSAGNLGLLHQAGATQGSSQSQPAIARYEPTTGVAEYLVTYTNASNIFCDRLESGSLIVVEDDVQVSSSGTEGRSAVASRSSHTVPEYLVAFERQIGTSAIQAQIVSESIAVPPVAAFTATPISGAAPLVVDFTDASTGNVASWAWDFDDNGTIDSNSQNPQHTFTQPGSYSVRLTVTGRSGQDDEVQVGLITVIGQGAPVADFDASPLTGVGPHTVTFRDLSTGAITDWQWSFSDGVTSALQNPTHTFTAPGEYTVILTVDGPNGSDNEIKTRYIVVTGTQGTGSTSTSAGARSGGSSGGCSFDSSGSPDGPFLPLLALLLVLVAVRRVEPRRR
jgi:PKD repeat protein